MYSIKLTPAFEAWMAGIKDKVTRIRLARRLDKAQRGNLGDIKSLGGGDKSQPSRRYRKSGSNRGNHRGINHEHQENPYLGLARF